MPILLEAINTNSFFNLCKKREMDEVILDPAKLDMKAIQEQLKQVYIDYLKGLHTGKASDFPHIESNFLLHCLESVQTLRSNGFAVFL